MFKQKNYLLLVIIENNYIIWLFFLIIIIYFGHYQIVNLLIKKYLTYITKYFIYFIIY